MCTSVSVAAITSNRVASSAANEVDIYKGILPLSSTMSVSATGLCMTIIHTASIGIGYVIMLLSALLLIAYIVMRVREGSNYAVAKKITYSLLSKAASKYTGNNQVAMSIIHGLISSWNNDNTSTRTTDIKSNIAPRTSRRTVRSKRGRYRRRPYNTASRDEAPGNRSSVTKDNIVLHSSVDCDNISYSPSITSPDWKIKNSKIDSYNILLPIRISDNKSYMQALSNCKIYTSNGIVIDHHILVPFTVTANMLCVDYILLLCPDKYARSIDSEVKIPSDLEEVEEDGTITVGDDLYHVVGYASGDDILHVPGQCTS